ncbi:MAG: class I SAM-dependent methyltransferase, partial [Sedimentisphaerales bacterium]|nr:class I SAM-dependent methyltransferase [Sedimentisphaerales bacterium]
MKRPLTITLWVLVLPVVLFSDPAQAKQNDLIAQAKGIFDAAGVQGGIVVHLGCGDGKLTAALGAADCFTIHGLEPDPAKVAQAREYIKSQSANREYGPVSVEQFSGSVLPYTDNLINLIVVGDAGDVAMEEMMRVLAPGGAVSIRR